MSDEIDGTPSVGSGEQTGQDLDQVPAQTPSAEGETSAPAESMLDAISQGLGSSATVTNGDQGSPAPTAAQEPEAQPANSDPQEAGATAAAAEGEPGKDEGNEADDHAPLPDEVTDAELEAYRPKVRRRIQQLLHQRGELRNQVEAYRPVTEFIQQHRLQSQDVGLALGLVAQLQQGDLKGFYETLKPYMAAAEQYLGQALPADLLEQVNQGYIAEPLARELAASRARATMHESQLTRERQARQAADQQQQTAELRTVIARSVTDWENRVRQQDPDYARKEPVIRRFAQALKGERGQPASADEAIALAQAAYEEANKHFEAAIPRPRATREQPSAGATARAGQPEPKSMFDALKQGLARAS